MSDLKMAMLVLLISSALGAASNFVRTKPLAWIREPLPSVAPSDSARGAIPSAGSQPTTTAASPRQGVVTGEEVLDHLAKHTAHFIDARAHHEYVEGHLRGALSLPSEAIYQQHSIVTEVVPAIEKVIVYCGGGQCEASHNVADALRRDFGFTDVLIYEKGWEEVFTSPKLKPYITTGEQP